MAEKQESRCACGAKINRWGEHRKVPRYNAVGGGKAALPGGYERQQPWGVALPTPSRGVIPWGGKQCRRSKILGTELT